MRPRILAIVVAVSVVALLTIGALAARGIPGTTRSSQLSVTLDVLEVLRIGTGIVVIGVLVWLLVVGRNRGGEKRKRGRAVSKFRWLPLIIALGLIAVLAFFIPRNLQPREAEDEVGIPGSSSEFEALPVEQVGSPWAILALTAVVALTTGGVVLLTRRRQLDEAEDEGEAGVAAVLSEAIEKLDWSDDPRSVIIKAYVDIERVLASRGMPRWASEAPQEYLDRILTRFEVEPGNIARLTTLFEVARFSDHQVDDVDATEAKYVMQAVRADLASVRS